MVRTKKGERPSDAPRSAAAYRSTAERRAKGKALRDALPRASHAGWKPAKGRRHPIEPLAESSAGRVPKRIGIRFDRMSESPVAF